ncbi:hypothetical protein [uncultured Polaribacter sp.]|uniref:hypothetical protein n=1 Tax=uncultured Polaribacter sp. TaxID=174711 RepID=UPI0026283545|nr:hypothetical protein [uncultured Polaribacter sp.]
MNTIFKHIKGEDILVKVKAKRDTGFWQYQLLGILSLFIENGNDYFIITDKRIILSVKDEIKVNAVYNDFSKININTKSDILSFQDQNNKVKKISLAAIKLEYDDYQYLKSKF